MPDAVRVAVRRALGLCSSCGGNPHAPDRRKCVPCLRYARELGAAQREHARKLGLCDASCGRRRAKGRTRCKPCAAKYLARQLERARQRRRSKHTSGPSGVHAI